MFELIQPMLKAAYKLDKVSTDGVANIFQFEQVQPSCTGFVLADEGLRVPECVRDIGLVKSLFFANRSEQGQQQLLLAPVCTS